MDKIPRPRATVPALRWQRVTYPLTRNFPRSPIPLECSQEKKTFGEWLLNAAVRDSGSIGAGYENELKDGRFKGGKKK